MKTEYVWLIWSSAFLLPWVALFGLFPQHRKVMWRTSLLTAPFGLTEPIFVPEYWNPPSLFDLAQKTGFDVESLIFSFGIGGVGAVLYNAFTGRGVARSGLGKRTVHTTDGTVWQCAPVVAFPPLYLLPWNSIYAAIAAMVIGATAAVACRPDLTIKTLVRGGLFFSYYAVFMLALRLSSPGYIEQVWNLQALTGLGLFGIPLEELLFGICFGMYWSSVYEHVTWTRAERVQQP